LREIIVGNQGHTDPPESIIHLPLEQVLPDGLVLGLHRDLGIAVLLTCNEQNPRMRAVPFFPPSEMATLMPLLVSYPDYCPNEQLLASFSGGTTEGAIEKARIQLLRAKERGEWEMMMRPMRNALSRVRMKLNTLGIDVRSIFETGYLLRPYSAEQYRRLRRA
jgi:hypothetical protein